MLHGIFPKTSDLPETFARGIPTFVLSSESPPTLVVYPETNTSSPRLPMVLDKNDCSGRLLCMMIGLMEPDSEWGSRSVYTERRLRTSREIMIDIISWLKDAPKALRSRGASCKWKSMYYSSPGEDNDQRNISKYSSGLRQKSPKSRGLRHGWRCIWWGTSQNL